MNPGQSLDLLMINGPTQQCSKSSTEEPGALASTPHHLSLVVALAALHLTGVPIAVVVSAGLAEPLQQVAVTGVDVRAGKQLPPAPSSHLSAEWSTLIGPDRRDTLLSLVNLTMLAPRESWRQQQLNL